MGISLIPALWSMGILLHKEAIHVKCKCMNFYLPAQLSPVNPLSHTQSPVEVSQVP